MATLTKEQKIEAYEYCLEKAKNNSWDLYVCPNLQSWLHMNKISSMDSLLELFPEFAVLKPNNIPHPSYPWWNSKEKDDLTSDGKVRLLGNYARVAALEGIIKKLKEE
jgi:hypothetical protein